jgi:MFS family permease
VNTPLAAVVSLIVAPKELATALSLNTMMFFIGGSFGATLFSAIVANTTDATDAWNPFHDGPGIEFSNAFAALIVPIGIALALSAALPKHQADAPPRPAPSSRSEQLTPTGAQQ